MRMGVIFPQCNSDIVGVALDCFERCALIQPSHVVPVWPRPPAGHLGSPDRRGALGHTGTGAVDEDSDSSHVRELQFCPGSLDELASLLVVGFRV